MQIIHDIDIDSGVVVTIRTRLPDLPGTRYTYVVVLVAIVTLLHYSTTMHLHAAHGIYRRLYYFPIILAAFRGGWPAGLITSLAACVIYVPHAFGRVGYDPGPALEKGLEMILYVSVGLVCGILVSRESRTLRTLARTAHRLEATLDEKSLMEGQLIRQARLASVGRLSAGLAHEIRNPLASIKAAAEIVADDTHRGDPQGWLLDIIKAETQRLNDVLTRFLAYARPTARNDVLIDLDAEVAEVVGLLRHPHGEVKIIHFTGVSPDWTLHGDREQIRQLLFNLIVNAIEAAGAGGTVSVSLAADERRLRCAVEDDGLGFSVDSLRNFGTPFYTTKTDGTGLGLAISHRIVEDHGGSIEVDESFRAGARIVIAFPRVVSRAPERRCERKP
ncbi:sensor histidine kinase [bacterium]|nr:sensor histidine kinase [bacterium]MBU1073902.1 sensor histidine kinase [bacterium]MBU1676959.1 sensor histidine kinase [bacterium]